MIGDTHPIAFRPSASTLDALRARARPSHGAGIPSIVRRDLERYYALIETHYRDLERRLPPTELTLVLTTLRERLAGWREWPATLVAERVASAMTALTDRVTAPTLRVLTRLNAAEQLALIDAIERGGED